MTARVPYLPKPSTVLVCPSPSRHSAHPSIPACSRHRTRVPGRVPLASVGFERWNHASKVSAAFLLLGMLRRSKQSVAAWRKPRRSVAISREKPICYFVFYLSYKFRASEQLGCSTSLFTVGRRRVGVRNYLFQSCKKYHLSLPGFFGYCGSPPSCRTRS